MHTIRITGVDHSLGRRVTLVEFKRVPDARTARILVQSVLATRSKQAGVYFELVEVEHKAKDGQWQALRMIACEASDAC